MVNGLPSHVRCQVCERSFDPTESRGWCPYASCGEWQHPSFRFDDGTEPATKTCPNCQHEVDNDEAFCENCGHRFGPDTVERSGRGPRGDRRPGDASEERRCPACDADLSGIPSDRLSSCPVCGQELTPVDAGPAEPATTIEELEACPNCGKDVSSTPPNLRLICPGCKMYLEEAIERQLNRPDASGGEGDRGGDGASEPDTETAGPVDAADREGPNSESAEAVPDAADETVDTIRGIGTGYAKRLAAVGVRTVGDLVLASPDDLSTETGIPEDRIEEWIERAPVDRADLEPAAQPPESGDSPEDHGGAVGTDAEREPPSGDRLDADAVEPDDGVGTEPTVIQRTSEELVLEVLDREVRVREGTTVGGEIRTAMVEAGMPTEDALYIHRKHVRIDFSDGDFFLTRLGENSLEVNGEGVDKGDRVRLADGDEVEFSGLVTAHVRID